MLDILGADKKRIITTEIKTLTCDPFVKEQSLKLTDGQKLVKPLFPDLKDSEVLSKDADSIVLESSTYYYQMEQNIKKIINKCRGNNLTKYSPFNIGVVFVNFSTSFEEFYAYLFNAERGFYSKLLNSNVDALVLISLDAYNDFYLENIYSKGYIQTALIKPTDENKALCNILRMDNYIAFEKSIDEEIYKIAQQEYGYYKMLCREGFVNIIPANSTEEEIQKYLTYLKNTTIRK